MAADDMADWLADCHGAQVADGRDSGAIGTVADRVCRSRVDTSATLSSLTLLDMKTIPLAELVCDELVEGDAGPPTPGRFTLVKTESVELLPSLNTRSSTGSSQTSEPRAIAKLREVEQLDVVDRLYEVAKVRVLEEEAEPPETPGFGRHRVLPPGGAVGRYI